ncbi:hypothetical protein BDN72DRAFT_864894 [Pluteus cervinus]|uniref:Uncharacterized protein n=1 Tax=Pluteus cervinus TaxID=181527 RepID=A0ACD3A4I1_9AGAR|nr:hypothetical protein BDN72DRAFT_864894 [Pluteus cervinus]
MPPASKSASKAKNTAKASPLVVKLDEAFEEHQKASASKTTTAKKVPTKAGGAVAKKALLKKPNSPSAIHPDIGKKIPSRSKKAPAPKPVRPPSVISISSSGSEAAVVDGGDESDGDDVEDYVKMEEEDMVMEAEEEEPDVEMDEDNEGEVQFVDEEAVEEEEEAADDEDGEDGEVESGEEEQEEDEEHEDENEAEVEADEVEGGREADDEEVEPIEDAASPRKKQRTLPRSAQGRFVKVVRADDNDSSLERPLETVAKRTPKSSAKPAAPTAPVATPPSTPSRAVKGKEKAKSVATLSSIKSMATPSPIKSKTATAVTPTTPSKVVKITPSKSKGTSAKPASNITPAKLQVAAPATPTTPKTPRGKRGVQSPPSSATTASSSMYMLVSPSPSPVKGKKCKQDPVSEEDVFDAEAVGDEEAVGEAIEEDHDEDEESIDAQGDTRIPEPPRALSLRTARLVAPSNGGEGVSISELAKIKERITPENYKCFEEAFKFETVDVFCNYYNVNPDSIRICPTATAAQAQNLLWAKRSDRVIGIYPGVTDACHLHSPWQNDRAYVSQFVPKNLHGISIYPLNSVYQPAANIWGHGLTMDFLPGALTPNGTLFFKTKPEKDGPAASANEFGSTLVFDANNIASINFPQVKTYEEIIPIYDGRASAGHPFMFTEEDFKNLKSRRTILKAGELKRGSVVAVGHSVNAWVLKNRDQPLGTGAPYLSLNVQFVILLSD